MIWDYRSVSRSSFQMILRGVPARGGRRGLRTLVSSVGLSSIRRVGVYFCEPLWAICILSVPRLCHFFRLMLWCTDRSCWPLNGVIILSWAMYAWELFMSYLVVHVLYHVVENPAVWAGGTICASISEVGAKIPTWRWYRIAGLTKGILAVSATRAWVMPKAPA